MAAKRVSRAQNRALETQPTLRVMIISGGTGRTAQTVLRSALAQFPERAIECQVKAHVRGVRAAVAAVRQASRRGAVVFHSLVDPKVRAGVLHELERLGVPAVDVLGPAVSLLADRLGEQPAGRAGLAYELNKEQLDRMEAVDFTLAHDDGQGLHDLNRADVVLVGVSRVAKSVTCFYLAYRGIRAANVPLIPALPIPKELVAMPPEKIIGLWMNVDRLVAIRRARVAAGAQGVSPEYCDPTAVDRELRWARRIINQHGWRALDVSYMAVEEIAREVRRLIGK
ncbi:MAG: putative pyruvate, phosphate dikinase regulatory protein [Pirellulaceae bacterium]|nr:MAG: putative pyruvate, phosphate dikinase regulatory protein [Pirellulaceae bacterium]GIW95417.1 MAG: putative pyruvate, phosphate dikinase regulatory protein [Pirellulaceae bacterium]